MAYVLSFVALLASCALLPARASVSPPVPFASSLLLTSAVPLPPGDAPPQDVLLLFAVEPTHKYYFFFNKSSEEVIRRTYLSLSLFLFQTFELFLFFGPLSTPFRYFLFDKLL